MTRPSAHEKIQPTGDIEHACVIGAQQITNKCSTLHAVDMHAVYAVSDQ